jgi:hypothetical protein
VRGTQQGVDEKKMSYFQTCYNQSIYPESFCSVTSQSECEQMNYAVAITPKFTAIFSMLGVSLIMFRFLMMKPKNRRTYDRLIFGMSIMNFWGSLGFFIGEWTFSTIPANYVGIPTSPFCTWQGWLLQINSAVFWYNGCLATNFVLRIRFGWSEEDVRRREPYLHVIAWFFPVLTSFIGLGLGMYGKAGPWCWTYITFDWARWAFFYAELWAIMLYTAICMVIISITVKRSDEQTAYIRDGGGAGNANSAHSQKKKRRKLGRKTREVAIQAILYVGTFLLTWVFGTANRIQNTIVSNDVPNCSVFALTWLHALFVPAQGFGNFIVYIYPRVKEAQRKRSVSDSPSKHTFKAFLQRTKDGVMDWFLVVFGRERMDRSDSQRDSIRINKEKGSGAQSGDIPSEQKSRNEDEDSNFVDPAVKRLISPKNGLPRHPIVEGILVQQINGIQQPLSAIRSSEMGSANGGLRVANVESTIFVDPIAPIHSDEHAATEMNGSNGAAENGAAANGAAGSLTLT